MNGGGFRHASKRLRQYPRNPKDLLSISKQEPRIMDGEGDFAMELAAPLPAGAERFDWFAFRAFDTARVKTFWRNEPERRRCGAFWRNEPERWR